jgi:hypothetical protein
MLKLIMKNDVFKKQVQQTLRRYVLNGTIGAESIISNFGASPLVYRNYLKHLMHPSMNFCNYGRIWSIDHIVPFGIFDLSNENDRKLCLNYLNTKPSFVSENQMRSATDILYALEHFTFLSTKISKNEIIDGLVEKCKLEISKRHYRVAQNVLEFYRSTKLQTANDEIF